ncbi:unnamed protein product [Rhizoctonia solani]|uniref:Integrase zinc-binding domain-containing protein n=1 Tax=Rhizoctonia solani TaxID=456999 RepID=A0A8H2XHZ9_9AGAM|nr:unnamed protein product [Rhizoctonia solani]CAE6505605.1 unnamed protein product [Rhizoctonia solani]
MLPMLRDDQPIAQETEPHNYASHTGVPVTRTLFSLGMLGDLSPVESNSGWKIFSCVPHQNPTANTDYDNPPNPYSKHGYWQQPTGLSQVNKRREPSSKNTAPVDMVGPDLVGSSHSFLERSGSAASITSATPWSPPSTAPSNSSSLKHRFLAHEMSSQRLLGDSPLLDTQPSTQLPKVDRIFVADDHIHLCGDDRPRYIDRPLEKNTFPGQGSPSNFVTTPVTHPAGFQSGILRSSSLLTSTGRSERAYIPIVCDDCPLVPQDAPSHTSHRKPHRQYTIARRTSRHAGAEVHRHSSHTSLKSGSDRSRGSLMDRHLDVDHSFMQQATLEDPTFRSMNSKSVSNKESIHSTTVEGSLLAKEARANHRGLPSRHEFMAAIDAYLSALSSKKLPKALITQSLYEDVIFNLRREKDNLPGIGTPQFRFWCRKHFVLKIIPRLRLREQVEIPHSVIALPIGNQDHGDSGEVEVVTHEGQPVVTREIIYDVLSKCHALANHAGRDKTTAIVKQNYSWVPKVLIGDYVKLCPHCCSKKTSGASWIHS